MSPLDMCEACRNPFVPITDEDYCQLCLELRAEAIYARRLEILYGADCEPLPQFGSSDNQESKP